MRPDLPGAGIVFTGADGDILTRTLLGDRLRVTPEQMDTASDSRAVCYFDAPLQGK